MIIAIVALTFVVLAIAFQALCATYPTPQEAPRWVRRLLRVR